MFWNAYARNKNFLLISVVFATFIKQSILVAENLPPVGKRVYVGGDKDKFGSLEIKTKQKLEAGSRTSRLIFRDPELDLEAKQTLKDRVAEQNRALEQREPQVHNSKSILDLKPLKVSGRYKQPTIPFNKFPIHLRQAHEALDQVFLHEISDQLPGL